MAWKTEKALEDPRGLEDVLISSISSYHSYQFYLFLLSQACGGFELGMDV